MSDWVAVARVDDIPPEGFKVVEVDEAMIAVFNLGGHFYAIDDQCTHDGGSLSGGCVRNGEIVCPRHGARFDIRTGAVTAPPAYEGVHAFPVRVIEDRIELRDDRWD